MNNEIIGAGNSERAQAIAELLSQPQYTATGVTVQIAPDPDGNNKPKSLDAYRKWKSQHQIVIDHEVKRFGQRRSDTFRFNQTVSSRLIHYQGDNNPIYTFEKAKLDQLEMKVFGRIITQTICVL